MKLALGTAQFGLDYGVANTTGQIKAEAAAGILDRARSLGVAVLDTAIAYGDSEAVLGSLGTTGFYVVTKLPGHPEDEADLGAWVDTQIAQSIGRLGVDTLYGVLLHRPSQLLATRGDKLYDALLRLKADGRVSKIGVSIYDPEELDVLHGRFAFELVQAPLNIIDRRLLTSGWADRLKMDGVEIHARSAFLQGLLLMPKQRRPAKFAPWAAIWDEWERWLAASALTPTEACIRYIGSVAQVDRIVVGVDSVTQLDEIAGSLGAPFDDLPNFPHLLDQRLLNPALWSQL
jgi:aryl-alcohol dehydrogenase-like predicted oxidoreductase